MKKTPEKVIKDKEEVERFLCKVKQLILRNEKIQINSQQWSDGRVNKTRQYMAETGIDREVILNIVGQLEVKNYSSTKKDRNENFPNEYFWEFGITTNVVDQDEDLYIKLKIREIEDEYLLIMSFHPEMPTCPENKLTFPYRKNKK